MSDCGVGRSLPTAGSFANAADGQSNPPESMPQFVIESAGSGGAGNAAEDRGQRETARAAVI